jgi:hypothetical protein
MVDGKKPSKTKFRQITFSLLKAAAKAFLFYVLYRVSWMFLAPIAGMMPGLQQIIEDFVIVYIFLMVAGELAFGTVFQHLFNAAKELFVVGYLISSSKSGIIHLSLENANLIVDLRLFLMIATLLGLLGFTKSALQAINFVSGKAERTGISPHNLQA